MPIEIEAKLRLDDPAAMARRLEGLGLRPVRRVAEVNTFYDTTDGSLKVADRGLRVRVETDDAGVATTYITHKGPRAHGKLKSRSETELVVDNDRNAGALLLALGYQPKLAFAKRRVRYELDGCRVELDEVPHLGRYIEIEGPTEDAVTAVRAKLGLADAPIIKASYAAMLQNQLGNQINPFEVIDFEDQAPDMPTVPLRASA